MNLLCLLLGHQKWCLFDWNKNRWVDNHRCLRCDKPEEVKP